ncbi:MAG: FKBP-type peptidyl-prolyl cis-trans isomerase [Woeseiaceae bacterium]|nr:FKBP-type peptidyl-prolyl cis-trans isomerase [Woeseiaceae bacterium]
MAENAGKAGVNVTDSGLQYRIIEPGAGKNPAATDQVTVNYRGSLTNGNPFDSGDGVSVPLNGVIKGWTEGLQLIKEGGTIELVIPPELAYGDRGPLAHRTLVFEVELISASAPKSN